MECNISYSCSECQLVDLSLDRCTVGIRVCAVSRLNCQLVHSLNETYLLKGDKDAPKGYSYNYATFTSPAAGAATFATDSVTGLKVTVAVATVTAINQDDIS